MKITVLSPCFNEIRFVQAWLQNCEDWGADCVVVGEGGSTDGTRDILSDATREKRDWIKVIAQEQPLNPQRYGFNESVRRQQLADQVKDGLQVYLDVDEMFPDDFREILANCLQPQTMGSMEFTNFWRSPNYIRIGVPGDENWGPLQKQCVYPAGAVRWGPAPNHSPAICALPLVTLKGRKYHWHYLYATPKVFENRIAEFKAVVETLAPPEIRLHGIRCHYPKALGLLTETVNFGDLVQ